jgi:hypothetical protein
VHLTDKKESFEVSAPMPQFTRAQIMLRYAAVTAFFIVFASLRKLSATDLGILAFVVIFNLKYMIYDVATKYSVERFGIFRNYWHLIGYGTAAVLDLSLIFAATTADSKGAFALLGLVVITPWVLMGGYALSWLEVFVVKAIKLP